MSDGRLRRPADGDYYVAPWSDGFLQGDLCKDVPLGFAAPPDAIVMAEGQRRFITGPFDAGPAMLLSPSCAIAAQGSGTRPGLYAHPARIMARIRPVEELLQAQTVTEQNVNHLRADRLRNYFYLPADDQRPESAALLYMPILQGSSRQGRSNSSRAVWRACRITWASHHRIDDTDRSRRFIWQRRFEVPPSRARHAH